MSQITFDLKGCKVTVGEFPGVGTKININGNVFRIVYQRETPVVSYTIQLVKKYEPAV